MKVKVKLYSHPKNEFQHQVNVIRWTEVVRAEYPQLRLLYHIPNGGTRDLVEAKNLKESGVKPGVPDLHLPVARGGYHSLYIEMKTETGKTSPEQDWWGDALRAEGNYVEVCHGWESAKDLLEWYLRLEN